MCHATGSCSGTASSAAARHAPLVHDAAGQTPFAAFLGCADSRVPIEIVFDQGFGDLFVTRIAGNVADPAIIGSLEFGTRCWAPMCSTCSGTPSGAPCRPR
jgi:carbonic anhydrase